MANSSATKVNLDVIRSIEGIQTKRYPAYGVGELFIYTPTIQNNESGADEGVDISHDNMLKILEEETDAVVIVRYYDEFVIVDRATMQRFKEESNRESGNTKKWCYKFKKITNEQIAMRFSSVTINLPVLSKQVFMETMEQRYNVVFNEIEQQPTETVESIIPHLHTYLTSKGFRYSLQNIANLYYSLRSKPFVILSGISGTGKTKIVQLFAEALGATADNGRYLLVPVRPDWSDSSDLIGYTDLEGTFQVGPLADIIMEASRYPDLPHFVVLDEMNLARVEHYLSEILSVMESRDRGADDEVTTTKLFDYEEIEYGLPENLYIIGTVNMDETTHPFSKKVLDRANSIEFNDINLLDFAMFDAAETIAPVVVDNAQLKSDYLFLKDVYPQYEGLIKEVSGFLAEMNEELQKIYAQVGYRVRDEICFYCIYCELDGTLSASEAMDFCVMQKILPRISGAGTEIQELLEALFKRFAGVDYEEKVVVPPLANYPRSARKVQEMLKRLANHGFTSFWIA